MGQRDFEHWTTEAARTVLMRRREMCEAALLPHYRQESINRTMDGLGMALYEIDHGDEIEAIEAMAKKRLEEIREKIRKAKLKTRGD